MEEMLNINIDILRRHSHSKDAKEALCFAIWCKMQHSNSIMYEMSLKEVKERLKVGYGKAKKLLACIDTNELFIHDRESRTFRVVSFRDKTAKKTRKGRNYSSAFVCKIPVNKDYTLKGLYNILNEKLFLLPIVGQEKNCLPNAEKKSSTRCLPNFITLKEFEKVVGMGHGSVCKIKKNLINKGIIKSTIAEQHCTDIRDDEMKKSILQKWGRRGFTFVVGTLCYLIIPCSYSIGARSEYNSFQHKIYNYHKKQAWHSYRGRDAWAQEEENPLYR